MAAPNIADLTTITGVTTFISGISATAYTVILSNAASSNRVLKLNTLMAANTTATTSNITIKIFNAASGIGNSVSIGTTISIPSGSSLSIIGKDTPIYIEENRSIAAVAGASNSIDIIASYEVFS